MKRIFLLMVTILLLIPGLGNGQVSASGLGNLNHQKLDEKIMLIEKEFLLTTEGSAQISSSGFSDVPTNHGFYKEITFLVERGVFSPSNHFGVNQMVTREEMAVLVSKAVGLSGGKTNTPFKDVPSSSESSGYINSAVKAGIVSGYKDGTFRSHELVSRGQMAIFMARAFNLKTESSTVFRDVGKNMAAYSSIKKIVHAGITTGHTDGTFKPENTLTRGQITAFLARAMDPSFKVAPPPAPAPPQNVIRGVNFTMNMAQVEKIEKAPLLEKRIEGNLSALYYNVPKYGYNALLIYYFQNGKLVNIVYDFLPYESYHTWRQMLYIENDLYNQVVTEEGQANFSYTEEYSRISTSWEKSNYTALLVVHDDHWYTTASLIYYPK